jgi:hypothetical protein
MSKRQIYSVIELNVRRTSEPSVLSSQSEFIQDVSIFSSSLVLAGFCSLIRSFFLAKLLAPEGFGIWRFINIFLDYLRLASLGTQPGMNQKVPILRGVEFKRHAVWFAGKFTKTPRGSFGSRRLVDIGTKASPH